MKNYRPGYSPKKRGYVPAPAPDNVRVPRGRSGAVQPKIKINSCDCQNWFDYIKIINETV